MLLVAFYHSNRLLIQMGWWFCFPAATRALPGSYCIDSKLWLTCTISSVLLFCRFKSLIFTSSEFLQLWAKCLGDLDDGPSLKKINPSPAASFLWFLHPLWQTLLRWAVCRHLSNMEISNHSTLCKYLPVVRYSIGIRLKSSSPKDVLASTKRKNSLWIWLIRTICPHPQILDLPACYRQGDSTLLSPTVYPILSF